ncbi:MAG TPA: carboxylesterase family protein [Chitinophaga sp.]|uniref:carboxylesterase/lipase family protein n=1 Tax=Chitinophaga sp. TaxID=1869181 RepID=UPI002DBB5C47|nr:carboxylesterase family protein [Chitinophaga sp.]HEU4553477.1 carboxylesterase family protein [Chitinophaga sp.]
MKKVLPAILLACLSGLFVLPARAQHTAAVAPAVKTAYGSVTGIIEKSGVLAYKGIPYAAPPVGNLRWQPPQPPAAWTGIHKADHFGPRTMQAPIFGDMNFRSDGMSEDCLYLNVWAPARKSSKLLPVLVYFYGGGFVAGDGSEPRYDGESMARKGIISLTVNYRLGVFGFFSHPGLTKESPAHASGNYGLMDQWAALKWVKENIAAFGGDPKRVTIAGESAGSIAVSAQMASPLAKDLFAGAIGESGSVLGALSAVPLAKGEAAGVEFAKSIGAGSLQELRALPADSLLQAATRFGAFRFPVTVDGYFFTKDPYQVYAAGEQAHVPLLAGWNSQEMGYQAILGNQPLTKENFEKAVRKLYSNAALADSMLQLYNPATDADVEQVATDLASDRFISFSTWKWIDDHVKTSGEPVFRYLFSRPRPAMNASMGNAAPGLAGGVIRDKKATAAKPPAAKGAVHSAEIEYAMGNLSSNKVYNWQPDDYKVSAIMQAYFANFVKNADPNGPGLPKWPAITGTDNVPVMHIDVHTRMEPEQHRARYLFLDRQRERAH